MANYTDASIIRTKIYPIIATAMSKNQSKYKRNLQSFFQNRSVDLYDIAPFKRIYFTEEDYNNFFKSIGVDDKTIINELSKTYYWNMDFNPKAAKDPLTISVLMIIRYFILKNDKSNAELSSLYLAFSGKFYPSIHHGKFPTVQPEEYRHVMEYVVNNMNMKFDLKREGNVFGAIRSVCRTWLNTYDKIFKSTLNDEDCTDLIQQLHNRIKSFMGNVATEYYKAYEEGRFLSYDSDSESDSHFRLADNDSLKIERAVENTMKIVNGNNVDIKLCKMASDRNVSITEIQNIIESIQSDNSNLPLIKELLRLIISEYMLIGKVKDVASYEFISKSIVARPNSKNKNVIRQKEIVEQFLDENSPQYRKRRSRTDTKLSYYKSVLFYYVLLINKANK